MKTINEIINDLVDFAAENNVLGNGKLRIRIGNLRVKMDIPIKECDYDYDEDEEVPTVENIMNNSTPEELEDAKKKAAKFDFDKVFENYNTQIVAESIKDLGV